MGVDPWVDWGTCPLLFEVEGAPCVVSPVFGGEGVVEIKKVATRGYILRLKCIKFGSGCMGLHCRPRWGSFQLSRRPLVGFKETYF